MLVGFADLTDRSQWLAAIELLFPYLAVLVNRCAKIDGQGIHTGNANPMKSSRNFIAVLVKLSTGMELGKHDLKGGNTFTGHDVDRNTPSIVFDDYFIAMVEVDTHLVAMTRKGLVNGVVDHFIHEVVESVRTSRTDVHAWAFSNCLQTFQDLDIRSRIVFLHCGFLG